MTPTPVPTAAAPVPPAAGPAATPPSPHRVVIEPPSRWALIDLGELWRYRELLLFLVWRDVKVRYKQTALGAAWAVLQPALTMAVFTVFFGRVAGLGTGDIPYPLYALSGILPWILFSTALTQATNSVVGSERLITKVYFPRLAVPLASVGAVTVDFLIGCGLLLVVALVYGYPPSVQLVLAPLFAGLVAVTAAGLGILLSGLNVMYRDFRYVVPFFVQLGMFATPMIYLRPDRLADQSPWLKVLLAVNPLNALIDAFRQSWLGGPIPWAGVGVAAAVAVLSVVAGCLYFRSVEDRFADVI